MLIVAEYRKNRRNMESKGREDHRRENLHSFTPWINRKIFFTWWKWCTISQAGLRKVDTRLLEVEFHLTRIFVVRETRVARIAIPSANSTALSFSISWNLYDVYRYRVYPSGCWLVHDFRWISIDAKIDRKMSRISTGKDIQFGGNIQFIGI